MVDAAAAALEAVNYMNMMTLVSVALFIWGGLMTALSMAAYLFTPAKTFLQAKFGGGNIILSIRRDRKGKFMKAKYNNGTLETKDGLWITDPESIIQESKSGARLFIGDPELGVTVSAHIAKIIQGLQNLHINSLELAERINALYIHCKACGETGEGTPEYTINEQTRQIISQKIKCTKCGSYDIERAELRVPIIPIETLKYEDLPKWNKTVMSAPVLASHVEYRVADRMMDMQKPAMKLISIGLMVMFILIGLAIFMVVGVPALSGAGHAAAPAATIIVQNQSAAISAATGGLVG